MLSTPHFEFAFACFVFCRKVHIRSHKSFDSKLEKGVHNRSSPSCREDFQIQRKASEQQFRSYSQQALCLHRTCNTQPLLFPCSFSDTEHHQFATLCLILENEVCYSNKGESGYCIEECQDTTMNEL
ncbi:unnamed protein product [Lactuca saligna]|uniref:Uncharacterized protein n=1 Tax=Lactuca saligna TaxID=75948 RepID=A0AA35V2S9_LACSI|nr:unnamed protein product [Lactuca saligna]